MKFFLAFILFAATQFAQAADPMGRIFYTPEQRAQLDALRARRAVASQVRNEPVPEVVTYGGIVRRSDGKATVWVNGEPLSETELRDKQSITGRVERNGQILLQTPQAKGAAQVRLKVGQSAELLSGQVDEPYATSNPGAAPKAPPQPAAANDPGTKPEARTAPADTKALPPELLEALRQAATRANTGAPANPDHARPASRP